MNPLSKPRRNDTDVVRLWQSEVQPGARTRSRARALRTGVGYLLSLSLLAGCGTSAEPIDESQESPREAEPAAIEAPEAAGAPVSNVPLSAEGVALRDRSNRLTLERRAEFHVALAERLELDGASREQFLRLLADAEAERLADDDSDAPGSAALRAARALALRDLLGPETLARYMELRETRREWYRPSTRGRIADSAAPVPALPPSVRNAVKEAP